MSKIGHRLLGAGTVAALLAVSGCSAAANTAGSGSGSGSGAGAVASVAKLVPQAYVAKGTLTVAEDASYAPNEFFATDGKTVVGMDADLARALGTVMGLKVTIVNASFDSILPGLASGHYDLGVSSFTDTKDREQIVDFVTYFSAGTSFFEKSAGGPPVTGLGSLCGLKVAVEKGTTQAVDAQTQSDRCAAQGHQAVAVAVFPDQSSANLALVSGRADVAMADSPLADYQVKQSHGTLKLVGPTYGTAPYGIAMSKTGHLAPALLAAVKALMADGSYTRILDRWGVSHGAITDPVINSAAG